MVEEFFMNKSAKKTIDFNVILRESKETLVHILFRYLPYVHPKFILKRKDFTINTFNALDSDGNTALLRAASRNNVYTVNHILCSKVVKEGQMLDLGHKNKAGKTLLHYLVENKDEENFRILLDKPELTGLVANIPDNDGKTPMIYCLTKGIHSSKITYSLLERRSECLS